MPPIELGPARPIGAIDTGAVRTVAGGRARAERFSGPEAASTGTMVQSEARDAGAAPIDAERVEIIRKAIETDTYPIVPTKVADAMIAAGMLLRTAK